LEIAKKTAHLDISREERRAGAGQRNMIIHCFSLMINQMSGLYASSSIRGTFMGPIPESIVLANLRGEQVVSSILLNNPFSA
jgi:hypothetical protein